MNTQTLVNDGANEKGSTLQKAAAYWALTKPRLSLFVVLSAVLAYLVGSPAGVAWQALLILSVGGFCLAGSSSAINQLLETRQDALMTRTRQRPLPLHKLTATEAGVFAAVLGTAGVALIAFGLNTLAGGISLLALVLYSFVYTPLKRHGVVAVYVGAVAGALPAAIGYTAGTPTLDANAWLLFGIQLLWQFPHFWAIAWLANEDYRRAGYRLLPLVQGRSLSSAIFIALHAFLLLPVVYLPYALGYTGVYYFVTAFITAVVFVLAAMRLVHSASQPEGAAASLRAARTLMFTSFIVLPVLFIAYYLDKV